MTNFTDLRMFLLLVVDIYNVKYNYVMTPKGVLSQKVYLNQKFLISYIMRTLI